MDLKVIEEKSKEILAEFIDEIGLDGKYFVKTSCTVPMVYIDDLEDAVGEYVTPMSQRYKEALPKIDKKELEGKDIENIGFIAINDVFKYEKVDSEAYITIIHEMIHSSRNLLIHGAYEYDGSAAVVYNNGKYEQTVSKLDDNFGDASQNILKASIDDSKNSIAKHDSTIQAFSRVNNPSPETRKKFAQQKIVDEALIEIMSYVAYKRNLQKQRKEKGDIWSNIEAFKNIFQEAYEETEDKIDLEKSVMCEIILKHHNFELFNWMLDPITYSAGDIHYDFFGEYTKNDGELVEKLYNAKRPDIGEDFADLLGKDVKDANELLGDIFNNEVKITPKNIEDDLIK